ncbi:hypothetical protein RND81_08G219300 [Saponaria officinalis]|uniref:Uncharacterized protein n=1 Tax=Saponaria officinalis TaxID=3572 RepID=A0AAW1J9S1_SAPOF
MAASTSTSAKKIDEQDVCAILQKYSPDTILVLLQEIANFPENKINWSIVAKNMKLRVPNPRDIGPKELSEIELKRLWRHLAYRRPLINSDDGDDDSDLEFEIGEVSSCLNFDASIMKEVVNCVQKLVSGSTVESNVRKNKEKVVKK